MKSSDFGGASVSLGMFELLMHMYIHEGLTNVMVMVEQEAFQEKQSKMEGLRQTYQMVGRLFSQREKVHMVRIAIPARGRSCSRPSGGKSIGQSAST